MAKYGQFEPPAYDLSAVSSRHIALVYSENDYFVSVRDVDDCKNGIRGIKATFFLNLFSFLNLLIY